MSFTNARRHEVERILVDAYITEAVKQGWVLHSVDDEDGDDGTSLVESVTEAVEAVFAYDECHVYLTHGAVPHISWFWFVLGNEGWTVLSDYTTDLDPVVDALTMRVDAFEEEYWA